METDIRNPLMNFKQQMAAQRPNQISFISFHLFLALLLFSYIASSKTLVTYLPGFDGHLPFYLETGLVAPSPLFIYFSRMEILFSIKN